MADYGCHPLWWTSSAQVGDIDPASLNLSDETIKRLEKWAFKFLILNHLVHSL
jgi:hypothetical protein